MQVILHAGAHCTDEDRLLRTLLKNAEGAAERGVLIPKPSRYRKLISATLNALVGAPAAPDAREVLLDTMLGDDAQRADRLILSHESFFTVPKMALSGDQIYPRAGERLRNFQKLFPEDEITLYLGLRNPATWLPAVYAATPHETFLSFLNGCEAPFLRWSELIHRLRSHAPGINIMVWCNEDTPIVWGQLARQMLGLEPGVKIVGAFDMLSEVISRDGMMRFRGYLGKHPDLNDSQKRQVMMAFFEKFALEHAVEEVIDVDGWTEDFVEDLTAGYDADVAELTDIPGVTLMQP